jgi:hypothetical protein
LTAPAALYPVAVGATDAVTAAGSAVATASVTIVGPDTVPPTAPGALRASVNQKRKQIELSWSPAADNVGVSGYRVWKNGVVVGIATTTSWNDNVYASGSYTVAAYDAAGNVSAPSASVAVTLSGSRKR